MRRRQLILGAGAALVACGGGGGVTEASAMSIVTPPQQGNPWTIGPIVNGVNESAGVPAQPTLTTGTGFKFDLPGPGGHANYITRPAPSLAGKLGMRMDFQILSACRCVDIFPTCCAGSPASLMMYLQRQGDNWTARGAFEAYRWYAKFSQIIPLKAGLFHVEAPFSGEWNAVLTSLRSTNPAGFQAALDNAGQIGFVLGGGDGAGHGVYATSPATFEVLNFELF